MYYYCGATHILSYELYSYGKTSMAANIHVDRRCVHTELSTAMDCGQIDEKSLHLFLFLYSSLSAESNPRF